MRTPVLNLDQLITFKNFCKAYKILLEPELVYFSNKNKYQGKIVSDFDPLPSPSQPSTSAVIKRSTRH